jgi:glycosyltransferase involved in cell wall biosynthesis
MMRAKAEPMRVLLSGMEWFPECRDGGLDRYFFDLTRSLAERGVEGTALVSSANSTSVGLIKIRGMAAKDAPLFRRWAAARALARQAFQDGVQIVNAHFALYAFPWLDLIPKHVGFVVNFQGPWAQEMATQSPGPRGWAKSQLAMRMERAVYRRADLLITLSEAFAELVCRDYGVDRARVRVVPGALNLTPYLAAPPRAEARRRLGWPAGRTILLAVRRLAKRMGLDLLIDAVAELRAEFPGLLLYIGGQGPERAALAARIAEHRLEEHVQLLGFISEDTLPLAYAAADASIVPTLALEGFGLITAESLASGTPVLGTPVGATPEILAPLDRNLVFAEPTAQAIAQRLREVLRGSVTLPERTLCRSYAERYGWPCVLPKILEVYHEAMEKRRD